MWPKRWNWASLRRTTACPRVRWAEDGSMPSLTRSGRPSAVAAASRSPRPSRGWSSATPEVRTRSCSSTDALGVDTATDLQRKKSTRRRNASTGRDEAGRRGCRRSPCHVPPRTHPARGPGHRPVAGSSPVLLAGCLALAGCVSVRPLELVPPDRVAQTSLVLDSERADGGGAARAGGPDGGAAGRGEPVDAAGGGRHRGRAVLGPRWGRLAGRGPGGGSRPGAAAGGGGRVDHHPAVREEQLRLGRADPAAEAGRGRARLGAGASATASRPSWRRTSTPSTSGRAPTGWRRPPRPTSPPGPTGSA